MPSMLEQLQAILESAVRRQPAGFADELLPAITVKELAAGVRAEIACESKSLGYVLLRRFVEFVQWGGR